MKYKQPKSFSEELINLIENKNFEVDSPKQQIKFAIHSPLLKQAFEYEIRQLGGISDGSFSKNIVTIKKATFGKLLVRLYSEQVDQELLKKVHRELEANSLKDKSMAKDLFRKFSDSFISTSGKKAAKALFTILMQLAELQ